MGTAERRHGPFRRRGSASDVSRSACRTHDNAKQCLETATSLGELLALRDEQVFDGGRRRTLAASANRRSAEPRRRSLSEFLTSLTKIV